MKLVGWRMAVEPASIGSDRLGCVDDGEAAPMISCLPPPVSCLL